MGSSGLIFRLYSYDAWRSRSRLHGDRIHVDGSMHWGMPIDESEWDEIEEEIAPAIADPFGQLFEAYPQALSAEEVSDDKPNPPDEIDEEAKGIVSRMFMVKRDILVDILVFHGYVDAKQADDGTIYYRANDDLSIEDTARITTTEQQSEIVLDWVEEQTQD